MISRSIARPLLLPLNPLYRLAHAFREIRLRRGWEQIRRLRSPVISIGNLSTGGAGKTPFVIALARSLTAHGFAVDVLSRGYGRQATGAARVDPQGSPETFGDEPLLIAREAGVPVYVAAQRYEAGWMAETDLLLRGGEPCIHILDDAFQHRQLHRDINILLLNGEDWRDRLLPAGNLREPISAITRADVVAIPKSEPALETELRHWGWNGPVWRLHRRMQVPPVEGPVLAFCGIARPEQFFAGLQATGLRLAGRAVFPDHYRYSDRDLDRLQATARSAGASALLTTAKDAVRLGPLMGSRKDEMPIQTARLTIEILDSDAAFAWLASRLHDTEVRPSV